MTCDTNGMCYLHCKYARGHQIRGCTFDFTQQKTNKQLPPVFVNNTENKTYPLESGAYNYTVHDWDGTDQWIDSCPADTGQITVERNAIGTCNHNNNNYDCYYCSVFPTDDDKGQWRSVHFINNYYHHCRKKNWCSGRNCNCSTSDCCYWHSGHFYNNKSNKICTQ